MTFHIGYLVRTDPAAQRAQFMERFHAGDTATLKEAWQWLFFKGSTRAESRERPHVNELRVAAPVDRRRDKRT